MSADLVRRFDEVGYVELRLDDVVIMATREVKQIEDQFNEIKRELFKRGANRVEQWDDPCTHQRVFRFWRDDA